MYDQMRGSQDTLHKYCELACGRTIPSWTVGVVVHVLAGQTANNEVLLQNSNTKGTFPRCV